jgi:hypothetical protein
MSTTPLFVWTHVVERNRPTDTGRRTEHGHRIIKNPVFDHECIEFPFNSGRLIGAEIYDDLRKRRRESASSEMLDALQRVMRSSEWATMDGETQDAVENAIALAMGL